MKHILRKDRKKYPDPTGQTRWFPPSDQLVTMAWQADASFAVQVMAGYTLTAAQEGQEVLLVDPGAADGDEGMTNQEGPPKDEEDDSIGRGGDSLVPEDGTGANTNFQGTCLHLLSTYDALTYQYPHSTMAYHS